LVRDIDGFEEIGLPVFARGLSANSPEKNGPGQVGLPIEIGELIIDAGDILVGDRNGVVVIPRAMIEEVIAHLGAIKTKEAQMEASIKAGARSAPWLTEALNRVDVRYVD
jgi:regulator of RNase E activity RraA